MEKHEAGAGELLDLIRLVYAAAVDPPRLSDALRALIGCVDAAAAQLHTLDRRSGRVLRSCFVGRNEAPCAVDAVYLSPWGALDPRTALLASLAPGHVVRCHEHFDVAFVAGNAFYQGFMIPLRLRWSLCALHEGPAETATVVCAMRSPDAAPFETWTAQTLAQVLPHFRQALHISARLVHPGDAPAPGGPALKKARLTPAEDEILVAMLQGLPAKTIAVRRGASFHTVRSQIVAILDKTGHHSQRELIASFRDAPRASLP